MPETSLDARTRTRLHIGLQTPDLEQSIAFYRVLFGREPTKVRPGYAKFEPTEPEVNLSLIEGQRESTTRGARHFGVEVDSPDAVRAARERFEAAGIATRLEEGTSCCYAVQDKVWAVDPDGNRWEVFHVLDPAGESLAPEPGGACGEEGQACCTVG